MTILYRDELERLYDAWTKVGQDYLMVRGLMLDGAENTFRSYLPYLPSPGLLLRSDVQNMNDVVRLANGSIPLAIWLDNAVSISGGREVANVFRELRGLVEARTSGAPRIDASGLPEIKEEIIQQDDMVPLSFLQQGLLAAESVARLAVKRFNNAAVHHTGANETLYLGTGFLVTPTLLVTNHHVVNARNAGEARASDADLLLQARSTIACFGFDADEMAGHDCAAEGLCAWSAGLDYAVLRLEAGLGTAAVDPSFVDPIDLEKGSRMPVNIIQHPEGGAKKYAIRNNLASGTSDTDIRYFTDTKGGSSGSPVFDDRWRLVALHRGATPVTNVRYQGRTTAYLNVGTKWSAIATDIKDRFPALGEEIF